MNTVYMLYSQGTTSGTSHFRIIQDYYGARGVSISSQADEPQNKGYSSGIGKLLKFSEAIVTIYNLLEKTVVTDIDLLEPLSKIVVYNMNEVFSLLQEIDYDNVDSNPVRWRDHLDSRTTAR